MIILSFPGGLGGQLIRIVAVCELYKQCHSTELNDHHHCSQLSQLCEAASPEQMQVCTRKGAGPGDLVPHVGDSTL